MSERRRTAAVDDVEFIAQRLKEIEQEKLERIQEQELPNGWAEWVKMMRAFGCGGDA